MNVEFFEEKTFYREASGNGGVWIIHKDAHILKIKASEAPRAKARGIFGEAKRNCAVA